MSSAFMVRIQAHMILIMATVLRTEHLSTPVCKLHTAIIIGLKLLIHVLAEYIITTSMDNLSRILLLQIVAHF